MSAAAYDALDRRALRSVAVQFFANGAVYATWIPRLPDIRERVDISIGALGLVLTLGSVASLVGFLLSDESRSITGQDLRIDAGA